MNILNFDPIDNGEVLQDHAAELLTALDYIFLSVVKLELDTGRAWLLQSQGQKKRCACEFDWDTYMNFYQAVLEPEEAEKLSAAFSLSQLKKMYAAGNSQYRVDLSCRPETQLDWLEIAVRFVYDESKQVAYVFTRQSGDNYLLRRIIDLYVYNNCDYFIYLDAKNNSYTMFSGSRNGTPLPPAVCTDYSAELVKYAEEFVVPEDREMVIREMSLEHVMAELERHEVHAFTCGVWEEGVGYTRKRLEYRYYNKGRQMILLSRTDITDLYDEQQRHKRDLESALLRAQTDPLTGLWNYQGIQEIVKKELADPKKKAALFFLDLDDFKLVNDTYGHAAGNHALQAVADILKKNIRATDYAARIGGDEFIIFLNGISSQDDAADCAHRICDQLSNICVEHTEFRLSGSIGVSIAPEDGTDYKSLVKHADRKVYRAKSEGKNQFAI